MRVQTGQPSFVRETIEKIRDQGLVAASSIRYETNFARYVRLSDHERRTTFYCGSHHDDTCDHHFVYHTDKRSRVCIACNQNHPIGFRPKLVFRARNKNERNVNTIAFDMLMPDMHKSHTVQFSPRSLFKWQETVSQVEDVYTNGYVVAHYSLLNVAVALGYDALTDDALGSLIKLFNVRDNYMLKPLSSYSNKKVYLIDQIFLRFGSDHMPILRYFDDNQTAYPLITHDNPTVRSALKMLETKLTAYIISLDGLGMKTE